VEYSGIKEYAGTFGNTQGQVGKCVVMQGIQGNTGENRGIQENRSDYSKMKYKICIYVNGKGKAVDSRLK
jgi:hypothetical protein